MAPAHPKMHGESSRRDPPRREPLDPCSGHPLESRQPGHLWRARAMEGGAGTGDALGRAGGPRSPGPMGRAVAGPRAGVARRTMSRLRRLVIPVLSLVAGVVLGIMLTLASTPPAERKLPAVLVRRTESVPCRV